MKDGQLSADAARLVVFIGGFDPRGVNHYYRLFAKHAVLQAQVDASDYIVGACETLDVGQGAGAYRHARWSFQGPRGGSDYIFFDWSDVVRAHWSQALLRVMAKAMAIYACALKEWRVFRPLRKQVPYTLLTFAYPLLYAVLTLVAAAAGAAWGWGWAQERSALLQWFTPLAAAAVAGMAAAALDKLLHVSWLLRIFHFARSSAMQESPILAARIRSMAQWLQERQQQQPDLEVVVLGFSVGSVQAVRLIDMLRELSLSGVIPTGDVRSSRLTLLTLGNCIPLFSLMPEAQALRSTLKAVAQDSQLYWADISSPGDSVSFGMCDLLALSLREDQLQQPSYNPRRMCSPRFHQLFDAQTYRVLRRKKMRLHFQYLMASQKPGAYNFFAMLSARCAVREFIEKNLVR